MGITLKKALIKSMNFIALFHAQEIIRNAVLLKASCLKNLEVQMPVL